MNRAVFDTYIETQLVPALQPGDVVIAGKLSFHKSAKAQDMLKAQGSRMLFLPHYSLDLRRGSAGSGLKSTIAVVLDALPPDQNGVFQTQSAVAATQGETLRRAVPVRHTNL